MNEPVRHNRYVQWWTTFLLVIVFLFGSVPLSLSASAAPEEVSSLSDMAAADNLLLNASFEAVTDGAPDNWYLDSASGLINANELSVSDQVFDGGHAVKLSTDYSADLRVVQRVRVKPDTVYLLSGYVLADGIPSGRPGANLSVLDSEAFSAGVYESKGKWQLVRLIGRTAKDQQELPVAVRLGFYSQLNKGTAWFDQLSLKELQSVPEGITPVSFAKADSDAPFIQMMPAAEHGGKASVKQTRKQPQGAYSTGMILAYAGIFLILVWGLIRALSNGQFRTQIGFWLAAAVVVRLVLAPLTDGYSYDVKLFTDWAMQAYKHDLFGFYADGYFADYPPGYIYVLYLTGAVIKLAGLVPDSVAVLVLIKLPALICDLAVGWLLYRETVNRLGSAPATALACLFWFNPAVLLNSAVWGQVDSVVSLVLGLYLIALLRGKTPQASVYLGIAVLIKPQALLFGLLYIFVFIRRFAAGGAKEWPNFIRSAMLGALTFIAGVLPFVVQKGLVEKGSLLDGILFIWGKYAGTLASYPYATVNAFNFHAMIGNNWVKLSDTAYGLTLNAWAWIGLTAVIGFAFVLAMRLAGKPEQWGAVMLVLLSGFVTLGPKMHERYLFPVMIILLVMMMYRFDRKLIWLFAGYSAVHFVNVAYVLGYSYENVVRIDGDLPVVMISGAVQTLLFAYTVWIAWRMVFPPQPAKNKAESAVDAAEHPENRPAAPAGSLQ